MARYRYLSNNKLMYLFKIPLQSIYIEHNNLQLLQYLGFLLSYFFTIAIGTELKKMFD